MRLVAATVLAMLATACSTPAPVQEPLAVAQATAAAKPPAAVPGRFKDNLIVYFLITDRFENGNPSNDHAYGRQKDGKDEIGTFHGGDLKGVTNKLKQGWFKDLGVNAIWITAPYEQIHGWVVGGNKEFKHYAYHGYYALDFTTLDQSMGTPEELQRDGRHGPRARHPHPVRRGDEPPGLPRHPDRAEDLGLKVLWPDSEKATLADYHGYIDYNNFNFTQWWGRDWVRAGLPGYIDGGRDDQTMQLAYLPDFRTDSTEFVKLPAFAEARAATATALPPAPKGKKARKAAAAAAQPAPQPHPGKPDTHARDLPDTTVRGYLVTWLTDWVREYGIDGFRCDTVKHVEPAAWARTQDHGHEGPGRVEVRRTRGKKIDDEPFWMVGEYWGKGPERDCAARPRLRRADQLRIPGRRREARRDVHPLREAAVRHAPATPR